MASQESSQSSSLKAIIIWICFFALPLFVSAGTIIWWNAWAFLIINIISIVYVNRVIYKNSPELALERATARAMTKSWDKLLVALTVAFLPMISIILSGLDKRFSWTSSITSLESLMALVIYIASAILISWSMKVNRFFSSHFHIQTERGHSVANRGPYAIIRHPAYLGMCLGSVALPKFLGSLMGLLVGIFSASLTVLRTHLEDRALQKELQGYPEYTVKVRYKLIPLLW